MISKFRISNLTKEDVTGRYFNIPKENRFVKFAKIK